MKKAMITGITGQDGAYLSRLLLEKGYEVYGAFRRTSDLHLNRLKYLGVDRDIRYLPLELLEFTNIYKAIERVQADEFYNLGAQSFVALSFDEPIFTTDVTAMGPLRVLEAIRVLNPQIKFYQASSSEMFGKVQTIPQDETTPFLSPKPLFDREIGRPLDHGELSGVVWPFCLFGNSFQPRISPSRP